MITYLRKLSRAERLTAPVPRWFWDARVSDAARWAVHRFTSVQAGRRIRR